MSAARLAADLCARASRAFASSLAAERGPALAAIDGFLAVPAPANYLAAVRELGVLRRRHALALMSTAGAERAFERGMREVTNVLGAAVATELAPLGDDLAADRRAGDRLQALAALAATRAELSARIAGDAAALRTRFAHAAAAPPTEGRLAFRGRRKAARTARRPRKK